MNCPYCEASIKKDEQKCSGCGSLVGLMARGENQEIERSQPFFYNGYIVWRFWPMWGNMATWQFWLGEKLVEEIELSREVYERFVPAGTDGMPFVWDLFEVAQGNEEVLRIQNLNGPMSTRHPATFEIRRIETEHEKWAGSISANELFAEIEKGRRRF